MSVIERGNGTRRNKREHDIGVWGRKIAGLRESQERGRPEERPLDERPVATSSKRLERFRPGQELVKIARVSALHTKILPSLSVKALRGPISSEHNDHTLTKSWAHTGGREVML